MNDIANAIRELNSTILALFSQKKKKIDWPMIIAWAVLGGYLIWVMYKLTYSFPTINIGF